MTTQTSLTTKEKNGGLVSLFRSWSVCDLDSKRTSILGHTPNFIAAFAPKYAQQEAAP